MPRFRVLKGKYHEGAGGERKTYSPGDIVTSNVDLVSTFGTRKFERIDDSGRSVALSPPRRQEPPAPTNDLSSLTVGELKRLAADEEIDLGGVNRKEDIVRIISEAQAPA